MGVSWTEEAIWLYAASLTERKTYVSYSNTEKKHKTLIILSLTHTEFINQSDLFPRPLIYSAHGRHLVSFHHHKIYALATFKQPAARQRNEHST